MIFYELEHADSGARHIHLSNDDRENTFSVAFKTVPKDSTGVAHILEHTVLCGSAKYPVRDPFFSMLKRSLSTFMNAFTASDWTMYPFSTQNPKDFRNLMDVYLDAVFFPKLEKLSFKQEGHRLEIAEEAAGNGEGPRLTYKGVVYNEMKGAMSSADQVMARSLLKSLYPSTTYSYNSGGEPSDIPLLTHAQLKVFHQQHYHPSNAYFYTYGNLPLKDHLEFIESKVLRNFARIQPDTQVLQQPRWHQPRQATFYYPLAENEDPSRKCQACIAWLTADILDSSEVLTLALLEQILLGNPGSPLRKALIDSQLGSALCDAAGFEADNRDTMFVAGLKDMQESAVEKLESIILEVLGDLATKGIDETLIESALHQIEFHRKEVTNTPYPYGIKQLLILAGVWIHGGDPLKRLRLDEDLKWIRRQMAKGKFFEECIQTYLLKNSHRLLYRLLPDQQMASKEEDRVGQELSQIAAQLKKSDIDTIVSDAKALEKLQVTEEDISCLPTLSRNDVPADVPRVSGSEDLTEIPVVAYEQRTSSIFYYATAIGAGHILPKLIPLVPFFCYALPKIGTSRFDFSEMANRIDLYTGGVSLAVHSRTRFGGDGNGIPFISFNSKCLERNQEPMLDIVEELIFDADLSNLKRLKNLLLEYRATLESMVIHNGHRLAISLASRNFSNARNLSEHWSGVSQLKAIKELTGELSNNKLEHLSEDLDEVRKAIFFKNNMRIALIGEGNAIDAGKNSVSKICRRLPNSPTLEINNGAFYTPSITFPGDLVREGWSTSSAVSFVAQAFESVRMEHPDAPALSVIAKILRSLYLHREIREKGGAYGGFSLYNPEDGLFCLASYRDPHIVSTLDVFNNAATFILSESYSDTDIDEAVLQVCSEIDKPDPPGPAARKAFYRKIIGLTDDERQLFKERLLQLDYRQVSESAKKYFGTNMEDHSVAVISGESQLNKANEKLGRPLSLFKI
jgi:Zn-dependent M16 (insulinase) family peptidase